MVFEQYKSQGAERKTYLPMPFAHVVGGDGWGFHVRTSRRVWFDVGDDRARRAVGRSSRRWRMTVALAASVAFYDGPPAEVLDAFLDEVGRAEELPDWVFGLWASGNEWNTQERVMRELDAHREHDIPVGSVVIEAWSDESTFTAFRDAVYEPSADGAPHRLADFDFPADGAWPDPKGMVDELHARGVRVHLWQIPLMKLRPHPAGQAAADAAAAVDAGVLIREPDAARAAAAVPQSRLVVPAVIHARPHRRPRRAVVDREAPLPRRGGRHRRLQDRRRRARLGARAASISTVARRRGEQPVPGRVRQGVRRPARARRERRP